MATASSLTLLLLVLLPARHALATAAGDAHPGYAGAEADTCGPAPGGGARPRHGPELEEYGSGRIVDITHAYRPAMPAFAPGATVGPLVRLKASMEDGSDYNLSELRMECHMGTHVDAPGHMNQAHFAAGLDVDTLDLDVLNGADADPLFSSNFPGARYFLGVPVNDLTVDLFFFLDRSCVADRCSKTHKYNR